MVIISVALCAVIVALCVIQHIERKDLYNRIMCEDLRDYKSIDKPPAQPTVSAHRKIINDWHRTEE